ncbi:flagellar filament capping protein FliD [Paracoccaceae bacterium]|nr:flagellar filament capping protein FliD [Paracoccaceae bacterium]
MAEIAKPDYLSLVNKGGSGFNVSELVTSIVASEIEPKRILQTGKLEKTENAISGIGYLNSQSAKTQSNFSTISGDSFFEITASNSTAVQVTATDETKLSNTNRTISEVSIAKEMVFELGSFSDLTTTFTASLTIDFGSWSQSSSQSDTSVASYETGKTYVANSAITDAADNTALTNDTDWSGLRDIAEDDIFTASATASAPLNSGSVISEIDAYEFTDADVASNETISFTDETVVQVAARLNSITGLSAQIIDTNGDGSSYSLIVSSDDTGADNGFKITEVSSSVAGRWATTAIPSSDVINNNFSQLARDASFKLDGIAVSRSTNSITDLIDGAMVTLKADLSGSSVVAFSRSESAIRQSINDTIFSLNEFKTEIDRLTFIDVDGDANGPLAMETAATMLKSNFKKLAVEPLKGFGSEAIYLSQLGVKTNTAGEFYLDEAIFAKTLLNNPEYFAALKDANLSASTASATITKSVYASYPPAETYTVSNDTGQWKFGDTDLTRTDLDTGGSRFSADSYPGLIIETTERTPANFDVYIGKSFAQKIIELMQDTLDAESSLKSAEDSYQNLTAKIEERLEKLDIREALITSKYTEQFGSMEQAMSQFNSTKSLLENLVESWNQK